MMKLIYTINSFLRPYRRILYKVTNFISMLLIFVLGVLFGLGLSSNFLGLDFSYYLERILAWVK